MKLFFMLLNTLTITSCVQNSTLGAVCAALFQHFKDCTLRRRGKPRPYGLRQFYRRGGACLAQPANHAFTFSNRAFIKILSVSLLLGLSLASSQSQSLTVFAAASLTESFGEIGLEFTKATGTRVRFQFAGSQILKSQLENGAVADVFASADQKTIQALAAHLEPPQIFARNRLVLITPKRGLSKVKTLADLAMPNVKLVIAQANVPIGAYTRQVLQKLEKTKLYGTNFAARVLKNVVSEESNVRQVALKVRLAEADAGIVYATDVTPEIRGSVIEIAIPERQNIIADYPIAIVRTATDKNAAKDFMQYVLGSSGQGILQKWGFIKKP